MNSKEKRWLLVIFVLAGIVVGGLIGEFGKNSEMFSWLNYGNTFGLREPLILNLKVLELTFGFSIHISISSVIGMILGVFAYSKVK